MSIYRKNEQGTTRRNAGNIVQRWNNRIFNTTHSVVEGKDYYTINSEANKYILSLTAYTFFQLVLDEPNETNDVYINYNGQSLKVTQSNERPILIGTLLRTITFYTLDLDDNLIWYDSPLELLPPEIKQLYEENNNTNAFTDAEKNKLATIEGSKFKGQYISYEALLLAWPTAPIGSYALVDGGEDIRTKKYLWDSTDNEWVLANDPMQELTPAQVKQLYEENDNTNAFTDAEKIKLQSVKDYTEILTFDNGLGVVSHTLEFAQDVTYLNTINQLTITMPTDMRHGYYGGVNFKTGIDSMNVEILNVIGFPVKIMKYDKQLTQVEVGPNKTVNMTFYCDGLNFYCYYMEV